MDHPLVASPMTRRESPKPPFSTPKRGRTSKNTSSSSHLSPQNGSQMRLNFTQNSNKGKGGSLPPSPVDETVLFADVVDSDEEEEEENEVFEDAGTPFVEDENNENLQPPNNNSTAKRVEKGALNRALRRELYQLTKSRDEVSLELTRLRNDHERVQAMRASEMEALNMHKSRIADAAQATAKEANRVEEMKKDVIERERRMKEELEEARQLKRDAEEMRIEAEEFLERQRRAEKAEAKMEEKGRDIERMNEWSNERMDELERKQEQVAVANAACEREAGLLKRDYERFEKNRREVSRAFAKREMDALKREESCEDRERRAERATKMREEEERLLVEAQEKKYLAEKHLREFLEKMKELSLIHI